MTVEKVQIDLAKNGGVNSSGLKRDAIYNGKDKTGALITTADALAADPDDTSVKINQQNQLYIEGGGPRRTRPIQISEYTVPFGTSVSPTAWTAWASGIGPITHIYGIDFTVTLTGLTDATSAAESGAVSFALAPPGDYSDPFPLATGALVSGIGDLPAWPITEGEAFMFSPFDVSVFLGSGALADFLIKSDVGPIRYGVSIYWG